MKMKATCPICGTETKADASGGSFHIVTSCEHLDKAKTNVVEAAFRETAIEQNRSN